MRHCTDLGHPKLAKKDVVYTRLHLEEGRLAVARCAEARLHGLEAYLCLEAGAGRKQAVTVDSGRGDAVVSGGMTSMMQTGTALMRMPAFSEPTLPAGHRANPSPQKPYKKVTIVTLPSPVHTEKQRIGDYGSRLSAHMELAGLGF